MDQQFSLSWNNFHGNLTKGFAGLLGNGEFVDVTIAVEGHLLQAHKVILSICSPYFKKMFQLNPCQHPIVVLRDVSHKAMRDLLQFMYHGEVSVKREDLTSFIGTAEVLQIKGLTNKETDEENNEPEKELSKQSSVTQIETPDAESYVSDTFDNNFSETAETDTDILKQRQFIEKLQRLSNLKRKSDEFLQKTYYSDLLNAEKRFKISDKSPVTKLNNSNFENLKNVYEDKSRCIDTSPTSKNQNSMSTENEINEKCNDQSTTDSTMELKTECDDIDLIVHDPAVCTTPKNYDRDGKTCLSMSMEYQSPQDNCTSLNSLFTDLKNLANGKVSKKWNEQLRTNGTHDMPRHSFEHRLVTIPQKEDGKKKYPQRSCRVCWRKAGRRRDTRFMCTACELPYCKSPCFEIHISELSTMQIDYYAT